MERKINPLDIAVENILMALDKTPRINWRHELTVALHSVKELGYAEGFRVGSGPVTLPVPRGAGNDTGAEDGLAAMAGLSIPEYSVGPAMAVLGEDKTLADPKPSPDEELEELGFTFVREIAKRFGAIAREYDLTPGCITVNPVLFDFMGSQNLAIHLIFRGPTLPKGT